MLNSLTCSYVVIFFRSSAAALKLPADFLLDQEGKIVAAKYGKHASDQWTVDELLAAARAH